MRTKNKTLVLGGGYAGLSVGYGNVLIIGLMRTLSVNTAYPFVALIYENNNCKKNMIQTKQCRSCGRVLPLTEYGINRAKNDGYQIYCKECTNIKRREYRDSVRRRERLKMYEKRNPEMRM